MPATNRSAAHAGAIHLTMAKYQFIHCDFAQVNCRKDNERSACYNYVIPDSSHQIYPGIAVCVACRSAASGILPPLISIHAHLSRSAFPSK